MTYFRVENLSAGYRGTKVLEDINFSLKQGRVTALLGANGSGKSTLLKTICGILPHQGSCFLEGRKLESMSSKELAALCGYIPQRTGISIDLPLTEVVLMGFNARLGFFEQPDKEMRNRALEALLRVGLASFAEKSFLELSEGQKQLCILARTLVEDRRLLILDEPESSLDFGHRYHLMGCIRHEISKGKQSALICLHDPQLALNSCDDCLLLLDSKTIVGVNPREQSLEEIEELFSEIYGTITLRKCYNKENKEQIVLLKEDELWKY